MRSVSFEIITGSSAQCFRRPVPSTGIIDAMRLVLNLTPLKDEPKRNDFKEENAVAKFCR